MSWSQSRRRSSYLQIGLSKCEKADLEQEAIGQDRSISAIIESRLIAATPLSQSHRIHACDLPRLHALGIAVAAGNPDFLRLFDVLSPINIEPRSKGKRHSRRLKIEDRRTITIGLLPTLYQRVSQQAEISGLSRSQYARKISICDPVFAAPSPMDGATRAELGRVKGLTKLHLFDRPNDQAAADCLSRLIALIAQYDGAA